MDVSRQVRLVACVSSGSGPKITLARKSGALALAKRVAGLTKLAAYVGIPASDARTRSTQLLAMAGKLKSGSKKRKRLEAAVEDDVTNAELLFIFSKGRYAKPGQSAAADLYLHAKGSPMQNQKPRPVLEPAVEADGNRQPIAAELAASVKASLAGDKELAVKKMKRAALQGQNAARSWFTDSRNNWAPNAPGTIARKGSDRPGIYTGAMRAAIVGIVKEE